MQEPQPQTTRFSGCPNSSRLQPAYLLDSVERNLYKAIRLRNPRPSLTPMMQAVSLPLPQSTRIKPMIL